MEQPLFTLNLDGESQEYIRSMSRWTKFLSILGFIVMGLTIIGFVIGGGFMAEMIMRDVPGAGRNMASGLQTAYVVMALVFAGIYFYPIWALYKFSVMAPRAIAASDQGSLTASLRYLRNMFRYVGILTIIVLSVYLLMFLLLGITAMSRS